MTLARKSKPLQRAPLTKKLGAKEPRETLQAYLLRIKRTEKEIPVLYDGRYAMLADLPPVEWSKYVASTFEEQP